MRQQSSDQHKQVMEKINTLLDQAKPDNPSRHLKNLVKHVGCRRLRRRWPSEPSCKTEVLAREMLCSRNFTPQALARLTRAAAVEIPSSDETRKQILWTAAQRQDGDLRPDGGVLEQQCPGPSMGQQVLHRVIMCSAPFAALSLRWNSADPMTRCKDNHPGTQHLSFPS